MTIEADEQINDFNKKLEVLKERQETYNRHEKLFNFEAGPCRILAKLIDDFRPLHMLWGLAYEWSHNTTRLPDTRFLSVRPDQMNGFLLEAGKQITKLKKELAAYPVLF
jgi:hypothetical protein